MFIGLLISYVGNLTALVHETAIHNMLPRREGVQPMFIVSFSMLLLWQEEYFLIEISC